MIEWTPVIITFMICTSAIIIVSVIASTMQSVAGKYTLDQLAALGEQYELDLDLNTPPAPPMRRPGPAQRAIDEQEKENSP